MFRRLLYGAVVLSATLGNTPVRAWYGGTNILGCAAQGYTMQVPALDSTVQGACSPKAEGIELFGYLDIIVQVSKHSYWTATRAKHSIADDLIAFAKARRSREFLVHGSLGFRGRGTITASHPFGQHVEHGHTIYAASVSVLDEFKQIRWLVTERQSFNRGRLFKQISVYGDSPINPYIPINTEILATFKYL